MIEKNLDKQFSNTKKGQKLFIVDLESVSFYNQETLNKIASNDELYKKTPFLYLIASYTRNGAMEWANKNYKYLSKKQAGSWMIYCFEKK